MSERAKKSFKKYLKVSHEIKQCDDPCLKNGLSDRYCLSCANEILEPFFEQEQEDELLGEL